MAESMLTVLLIEIVEEKFPSHINDLKTFYLKVMKQELDQDSFEDMIRSDTFVKLSKKIENHKNCFGIQMAYKKLWLSYMEYIQIAKLFIYIYI